MPADASLATALGDGYRDALDEPFLSTPEGPFTTYAQTEARADAFAGALRSAGVGVGDRVVVKILKSADGVALYLACLRMGAVFVPLNPSFTAAEQAFHLHDADPAVLVTAPDGATEAHTATLTLGTHGEGTLVDAAEATTAITEVVPREPDDVAVMLYTSGTTGRPKGAMLTHGGLSANARALHDAWGFGPADVLVHPLPVFHAHGLFVALHTIMLGGGRCRFLPRFSVDGVLDALPGATVMMGVPTMYSRLLADARFDAERCRGMRLFTSGSAPMSTVVHEAFTARTGLQILERYGMTEAGMITSNPLHGERVPGTVGFALPGYEVRVTDEAGVDCAVDVAGMVEIRGDHLFAGYWRLPDKTAEAFRSDGFFVTGDIGSLDAEGRLTLQGRAGDMIISGGENIYPKEIEQCLDEAPGVKESAVVGAAHADFGETVVAFLVLDVDAELHEVQQWVDERLAPFKRPRRYEVTDALPRNAMGKVQKNVLRDRAEA